MAKRDNNPGTFPIQSERLYNAIQRTWRNRRFVQQLPFESQRLCREGKHPAHALGAGSMAEQIRETGRYKVCDWLKGIIPQPVITSG